MINNHHDRDGAQEENRVLTKHEVSAVTVLNNKPSPRKPPKHTDSIED